MPLRVERLPGFQALTKSSRHGRITLVRRTQRFGRGLSWTRPPGFRRHPSLSVFYLNLLKIIWKSRNHVENSTLNKQTLQQNLSIE